MKVSTGSVIGFLESKLSIYLEEDRTKSIPLGVKIARTFKNQTSGRDAGTNIMIKQHGMYSG